MCDDTEQQWTVQVARPGWAMTVERQDQEEEGEKSEPEETLSFSLQSLRLRMAVMLFDSSKKNRLGKES